MSNARWQAQFNYSWPENNFRTVGWFMSKELANATLMALAEAHFPGQWHWNTEQDQLSLDDPGKSMYNMGWMLERNPLASGMYTAYLFDLDDTLIEGFVAPPQPYSRVQVLPGRVATLSYLMTKERRIGIVTNQGNIAFGYQTEQEALSKFREVYHVLGLDMTDHPLHFCFSDTRSKIPRYSIIEDASRRKPSGKMIREVMVKLSIENGLSVLYCGDRKEDRLAAEDAGVDFIDTDVFPWLTE